MAKMRVEPRVVERTRRLFVPSDRPVPPADATTELIRGTFDAGAALLRGGTAGSTPLSGLELPLLGRPDFVQLDDSVELPQLMVATTARPISMFGLTLAPDGADFEVIGAVYGRSAGEQVAPTWWLHREHAGELEFAWGFPNAGVIAAVRPVGSSRWYGGYSRYERRGCVTAQEAFDALLPLVTPRPDAPDSRLRGTE
jgi:hypothetical protein